MKRKQTMLTRSPAPFVEDVTQLPLLSAYGFDPYRGIPRKRLVCHQPELTLRYKINPFMHPDREKIDQGKANMQWREYRLAMEQCSHGCIHEIQDAPPEYPDITFLANTGITLVDASGRKVFIPGVMRFKKERGGEPECIIPTMQQFGYSIEYLTGGHPFEGSANLIRHPHSDVYYGFYGFRTSRESLLEFGERWQKPVIAIELVDPNFYDGDTAFCPISYDTAIVYRGAFTSEGIGLITRRFTDVIWADEDEAFVLGCNAVALNRTIVITDRAPKIATALRARNFHVRGVALSEYLKLGGAAACLQVPLEG